MQNVPSAKAYALGYTALIAEALAVMAMALSSSWPPGIGRLHILALAFPSYEDTVVLAGLPAPSDKVY